MNYQRIIKQSYLFESAGYALLLYGIGSVVSGVSEKSGEAVTSGLQSIISGATSIGMVRIIRGSVHSVQETQNYFRSLEKQLE